MAPISKSEFKKLERAGRAHFVAGTDEIDLAVLNDKFGLTPKFHSYRDRLYFEGTAEQAQAAIKKKSAAPAPHILKPDVAARIQAAAVHGRHPALPLLGAQGTPKFYKGMGFGHLADTAYVQGYADSVASRTATEREREERVMSDLTPEARAAVEKIQGWMNDKSPRERAHTFLALDDDLLGITNSNSAGGSAEGLLLGSAEGILDCIIAGGESDFGELTMVVNRIRHFDSVVAYTRSQELFDKALRAGGKAGAELALSVIHRVVAGSNRREAQTKYDKAALRHRVAQAQAETEQLGKAPKLERLQEGAYHKLLEAWLALDVITLNGSRVEMPETMRDGLHPDAHVFVVQHDWASAFAHATDFDGGDWKLPFDWCVFEFRISGKRTILLNIETDAENAGAWMLLVESTVGWCIGSVFRAQPLTSMWKERAPLDELMRNLVGQVRAVSIALEAEVAVTEVVRAPHRLNAKRERHGRLPLFDHHVISLAARKRYAPRVLAESDLETEHRKKRLHFVRGHFRHYANHKVWIKWFLRGDPDLGFVDKEYRL